MEVTMAADFYGNALIISERARARHLEAEAHRLANIVSKKNAIRHGVLKGTTGVIVRSLVRRGRRDTIPFRFRRSILWKFSLHISKIGYL
jgi:hypothetical protein